MKNRAFRCGFQREGDGGSPSASQFAASLERPHENAAGASRYRSAEMCESTIRVVPRLTSPLYKGRGFYSLLRNFLSTAAPLPLPLGEVAERSEDGEGKLPPSALSVACGDSSPKGRAKRGAFLASPLRRGGRAKRGRSGYTVTARTLSVACGDSSPKGRAKGRLRHRISFNF